MNAGRSVPHSRITSVLSRQFVDVNCPVRRHADVTNPRQVFNLAVVRALPDDELDGFHADERICRSTVYRRTNDSGH